MRHFPIFLDLRGVECLVVGGGPVGARRAAGLVAAGARVRIVASEIGAAARALARRPEGSRARRRRAGPRRGSVRFERRRFRASDLSGCALVVAATGDGSVDAAIAREARRRRIPCNVPGDPERGSFIVPAVARHGGITLAVSTGGASPTLARRVARRLARSVAQESAQSFSGIGRRSSGRRRARRPAPAGGSFLRLLRGARRTLRLRVPDAKARRRTLRRLAAPRLVALIDAGRLGEARGRVRSIMEAAMKRDRRGGKIRSRPRRL